MGRKNWRFTGSDNGGPTATVHFSLIATCKLVGLESLSLHSHVLPGAAQAHPQSKIPINSSPTATWLNIQGQNRRSVAELHCLARRLLEKVVLGKRRRPTCSTVPGSPRSNFKDKQRCLVPANYGGALIALAPAAGCPTSGGHPVSEGLGGVESGGWKCQRQWIVLWGHTDVFLSSHGRDAAVELLGR